MKALSLFTGIGGLDLAAEQAGIKTIAMCENDPYASQILQLRWPDIPKFSDIRELSFKVNTEASSSNILNIPVTEIDVIHGGFPCQDLSVAGRQKGLEGQRSGLWYEMLRIISEIRPAYVLAENVRGAINLALDTVHTGMEEEGYEIRTLLLPAAAFGAPHQRYRIFIVGIRKDVAHTHKQRLERWQCEKLPECSSEFTAGQGYPFKIPRDVEGKLWPTPSAMRRGAHTGARKGSVSADGKSRVSAKGVTWGATLETAVGSGMLNPDWVELLLGLPIGWSDINCVQAGVWPGWPALLPENKEQDMQYAYEPPRVITDSPNRRQRLTALGNAVVPQQALPVFQAIKAMHDFLNEEEK